MKVAKCTRNLTLIHNGNKWYLVTNKEVTKVVLVGSEYSGLICNICHFRGYCNELFSNHSICNSIDAYLTCKRSPYLSMDETYSMHNTCKIKIYSSEDNDTDLNLFRSYFKSVSSLFEVSLIKSNIFRHEEVDIK
jgi:hypothetical protein